MTYCLRMFDSLQAFDKDLVVFEVAYNRSSAEHLQDRLLCIVSVPFQPLRIAVEPFRLL